MKTWVYSWIIYPLVFSAARLLGVFNPKIRNTLRLRSWKEHLSLRFNAGALIDYWIHVASAGELEYAIPVLRELESRGKRVLVTYYSISAKGPVEQLPQQFRNVSLVVPLPHDGLGLMKEFVALARRQGVGRLLLLKYELWPGLLWECNRQGIRVVLIDALEPSWFHRRLLHKVDSIMSGYESEVSGLEHRSVKVLGDTRVERVLQRVEQSSAKLGGVVSEALRQRLGQGLTLVVGSMWPPDDEALLKALEHEKSRGVVSSLIWVPHELNASEAAKVSSRLKALGFEVVDFDQVAGMRGTLSGERLAIIVMKKGLLAELYRLGHAAYVGGGFGSGIHSVWEPALCGIRVACGPRTRRSPEARELAGIDRLTRIETDRDLSEWLAGLSPTSGVGAASGPLEALLSRHHGASKRIVDACESL